MARQVGCSAITLRKLEAEERRPSKQIAERLAEVLNVAPDERPAFLRFARGDPFATPADFSTADQSPPQQAPQHNLPDHPPAQVNASHNLPSGTLTLLFTDQEGSTRLLQQAGAGYVAVLHEQRAILRAAFTRWNGSEVDAQGDAFFVAFQRASDAVQAAVEGQRALAGHAWPPGVAVMVRMGLHTGEPELGPSGYTGLDVHRAARIGAAGHDGQVLLSQTTRELLLESDLPAGVSLRDMGEHRLKDLRRPRRLYQLVVAGLPADFPPLRTLDTLRHNLPIQLTTFIGRERDLAAVKLLLASTRLLTLTGVGGTGKTRLALQVATELLGEFGDGVFFVNLAPIPNPDLVALTIAQTLAVSVLSEQLLLERLKDHLRDKHMLLVLDNFEHLLEAAPQLTTLLAVAPGLTLLVTSRVVLHLSGEQELPVPPLAVPDLQQLPGVETLSQVAAVALFIQRAQAAQPDFQMTETTAPAVAEICVRLDGLPLAIELAAARSKVLQPAALLARLSSRLGLLTGGARDLPARQQTLRSTIEWSYRLLAAEEQVLFVRLGVFAGGWTLEAAEPVCNAAGDLPFDMLDGLQALLDHSLLTREVWSEGTPRFSMLETIGEYARERLEASGEAQAIRRQHAAYFLALAEAGVPPTGWQFPEPARLDQIAMEHDNLRAAMTWAQSAVGDPELGLRLATAMVFSGWDPGRISAGSLMLTPTPPVPLSAGPLSEVPRNRTVVVAWPLWSHDGVTNPWNSLRYTHGEGNNLLWEGLAYYGIFAGKEIPWLAQSLVYTKPDFTELTIQLNPLARWSDGQPVSAQDVVFTFQGQLDNDLLPYHFDFQKVVQAFKALDDQTIVLTFKVPAPRFKFEVLTLKFDTGMPIVPAHVLRQQADVNAYAGGLDLPHSGPYNLIEWNADRKIYDLRPDWWAVGAGLIAEPAVKRVTIVDVRNASQDTLVQGMMNNDFDTSLDLSHTLMANVLEQNPKITTHTGEQPPYGYLDWWPLSLWVNTQLAPYDDARVRRAFSLAIDRRKLDQLLFAGAAFATVFPFPLYPALQKFVDSPDVKALEAKYAPGKCNLAESARLMTAAGFVKNSDGLWARAGQTLNATVYGQFLNHADIAQILVEMFRQAGFDSSAYFGFDSYAKVIHGSPGLYLYGHSASVTDPYATFELYHSRHSQTPPSSTGDQYFSRYRNPAYDQIVDSMAVLSPEDPKFHTLAVQALEIYWRDVIDIPVAQGLHRIPYNQTYWTNWPTQDNLAMGTNGAFWAHTGMLVITSLRPAQ